MKVTYPKEGTQARRVLDALLDADGSWVNKSYLVRSLGFTQAGTRIHELERQFGWTIEHSTFSDEYGFRSFRIVQPTAQLALPITE